MTDSTNIQPPNSTKPKLYRHLLRRLRLLVSTRPTLYAFYARLARLQFQMTDRTSVVVDSYPRSANSFFEAAFTRSHGGREVVAHHSHAAAQVLAGVKRGLPCIVLLREPEAAIASFYEMSGGDYPIELCTREYSVFYTSLLPVIDKLIIVETEQIEARFHDLMVYLRDKHGLAVEPYEIDAAMHSELLLAVDETGRHRNGFAIERYSETLSKVEKQSRRERLDAIRTQIRAPQNATQLARCRTVYQEFKSHGF